MTLKYGTLEFAPCVFDEAHAEGWVLYDETAGWKPLPMSEICQKARVIAEQEFKRAFPNLPPAPVERA